MGEHDRNTQKIPLPFRRTYQPRALPVASGKVHAVQAFHRSQGQGHGFRAVPGSLQNLRASKTGTEVVAIGAGITDRDC
jgi:hypothetical protein